MEFGSLLLLLKTGEKIAKCQETLAAVIYRSQPAGHDLSPASNPDLRDLLNDVIDLYQREILKGIQLIEVTLQLPRRVVLVPALPCILDASFSWFITTGFHVDEFFVLEKEAADENFHLHGITEPRPSIDDEISSSQLQIEVHFLKNYRSAGMP